MTNERANLSRRQLLASGAAISAGAVLAGCVGDDGGDGDSRIHITQQVEPAHDYDPVVSNDAYSVRILNHFFDGLYEFDEGLSLEPKLATGDPEVERDGTRYVVEITGDAEFHNGDPVTAEDVLHSFIAPVVEETENVTEYDMIDVESSTTIDDTTVQIDLAEPYAPFETVTLAVNVVNKSERLDALDMDEEEWWDADEYNSAESEYNKSNPIGSGPFQYVEHVDGEYTDTERWDDYWDEPLPNLAEARWVATEDDASRVSQIKASDTDVMTGLPPEDWQDLVNDDQVDVYSTLSVSYFYMAYNCTDGPTAESDVRNGVEHAFSATAFVDEIIGDAGANAISPLPPSLLEEWDLPAEKYEGLENEYDPERAADLIGPHLDGVWEPTIIAPPDDIRVQLAERVATRLGELEEHGVEIDPQVQRLDWTPFLERYTTGDADDYAIYTLAWTGGSDPDVYMWPLFHESNAGVTQGTHYDPDTAFHENIKAARETIDQSARRELYDQVITELLEETVNTPAYHLSNSIVSQPYVDDLAVHPDSGISPRLVSEYNNVSVE